MELPLHTQAPTRGRRGELMAVAGQNLPSRACCLHVHGPYKHMGAYALEGKTNFSLVGCRDACQEPGRRRILLAVRCHGYGREPPLHQDREAPLPLGAGARLSAVHLPATKSALLGGPSNGSSRTAPSPLKPTTHTRAKRASATRAISRITPPPRWLQAAR